MKKEFVRLIVVMADSNYPSGFGVDAKNVGNALDDILSKMEEYEIEILPDLIELKQYLRLKGNSKREQHDLSLWKEK